MEKNNGYANINQYLVFSYFYVFEQKFPNTIMKNENSLLINQAKWYTIIFFTFYKCYEYIDSEQKYKQSPIDN